MSDPTPATAKTPHKPKGRADMPKQQVYHANRKSVAIRRLTKAYRQATGKTRLTPEDRSTLAFFTLRYEVGERAE